MNELPRLGFVGTGWIGRHRMEAILASGWADAAAIVEPDPQALERARALAPRARVLPSLDDLLQEPLEGVVIATPSAHHAAQSIAALEAGMAVFCQKPLGRNAAEVRAVVDAARKADRLLSVDFSYRHTAAVEALRRTIDSGALGRIYFADLVFHNAYGPDKPWFFDPAQSGGGCLMDLGVHLVDLALWLLGFPQVEQVSAWTRCAGEARRAEECEDFATAELDLAGGTTVRIACSWNLHAGRDAVIEAAFHGTLGGVSMRNVAGSFYDFETHLWRGTASELLAAPPDAWGGRAALHWARQLARDGRFDPNADELVQVAEVIDRIYSKAASGECHEYGNEDHRSRQDPTLDRGARRTALASS